MLLKEEHVPNPGRPFPFTDHPDLPPDPSVDPSKEAVQSSTPQQPPAEPTPAQEQKLLAGKYRNVEELEKGYNEFRGELDRIREENRRELDRERQRVDQFISQARQPQPQPRDPLEELNTYGVPADPIREAIRSETARMRQEFENEQRQRDQLLAEARTKVQQARSAVARQYPDFIQKAQSIADFVDSDTSLTERYSRLYETDPATAMEWAYLRYRDANPAPKRQSAAENPVTGALPAGQGTGERQPGAADQAYREELAKAREYYKTYKDPMPYVRARMRGLIPDSHFQQG